MRGPEYGGFTPPEAPQPPQPEKEEASKGVPETAENREAVEKFIDAALEELCERHLSKFNEGNNGIILKLRMEDIPPKLLSDLKEAGIELGDQKVAKILKIYSGGKGRQEFEMQKKAHELVDRQPDKEKYAQVPRPYFYRDFAVGDAAKESIKGMTEKPYGADRVEMFMMDFVPGDDVAAILHKEVARRHPKTVDIADHVDEMRFDDLQDRVQQALGFARPGGKSRDDGIRDAENRKVNNENAKKIDTFLDQRGFHIDPAVVSQIENTMALFHKNGLAFRDGHQRNFMISGDYAAAVPGAERQGPPQVFVIDFGAATELGGRRLDDVFHEVDGEEGKGAVVRNYPDDLMVAKQLKRFTVAPKDRINAEEREYLEGLERNKKTLDRNPRLAPTVAAVMDSARSGKPDMAAAYSRIVGGSSMPSEGAIDNFLNVAYAVADAVPEAKEDVRAFVSDLARRPGLPFPTKNKLSKFLRVIR